MSGRPAVFLDRDGVLNVEVNYLHDPDELVLIDGVVEAVASFNRAGVPVIVITNQAGVGRGYYTLDDYQAVNARMSELLAAGDAHVDAWYCCPHAPWSDCACRKPRPGMLVDAAREHDLALAASVLVGDKESDLGAARAVGCRPVLVRTGYGREEEVRLHAAGSANSPPFDRCFDSLADAAPWVLAAVGGAAEAFSE